MVDRNSFWTTFELNGAKEEEISGCQDLRTNLEYQQLFASTLIFPVIPIG